MSFDVSTIAASSPAVTQPANSPSFEGLLHSALQQIFNKMKSEVAGKDDVSPKIHQAMDSLKERLDFMAPQSVASNSTKALPIAIQTQLFKQNIKGFEEYLIENHQISLKEIGFLSLENAINFFYFSALNFLFKNKPQPVDRNLQTELFQEFAAMMAKKEWKSKENHQKITDFFVKASDTFKLKSEHKETLLKVLNKVHTLSRLSDFIDKPLGEVTNNIKDRMPYITCVFSQIKYFFDVFPSALDDYIKKFEVSYMEWNKEIDSALNGSKYTPILHTARVNSFKVYIKAKFDEVKKSIYSIDKTNVTRSSLNNISFNLMCTTVILHSKFTEILTRLDSRNQVLYDNKEKIVSVDNHIANVGNIQSIELGFEKFLKLIEFIKKDLIDQSYEGVDYQYEPLCASDMSWLDVVDVELPVDSKKKKNKKETAEKEEVGQSDLTEAPIYHSPAVGSSSAIASSIAPVSIHETEASKLIATFRSGLEDFYALTLKERFSPPHLIQTQTRRKTSILQQLYSLDHFQWSLEMLQKTTNPVEVQLLIKRFYLWGYLAAEQGLSAECLSENDELFHGISSLLQKKGMEISNYWTAECNRGSNYFRYPFSYLSYLSGKSGQFLKIIESAPEDKQHKQNEFKDNLQLILEDSLKTQLHPYHQSHPIDVSSEFNQLVNLSTSASESEIGADEKQVGQSQFLENQELNTLQVNLEEALNTIKERLVTLTNPLMLEKNKGKQILQNMLFHLESLITTPALLRRFPEQRYLASHLHMIYISSQYLIENLGIYFSMSQGQALHTHNLSSYLDMGMKTDLDPNEIQILESLNVGKGFEYPYNAFTKGYDRDKLIPMSDYYAISRSATLTGEGFFPSCSKDKPLAELQLDLINRFTSYANVILKLTKTQLIKD